MTNANRNLTWKLGIQDNASTGFSKLADNAESSWTKIGDGVSNLGNKIGGEVGEIVSKFGEGFTKIGDSSASTWQKISAGAGALAGVGVALQGMASKDEAAQQQLQASIQATGGDWDDYDGRVESSISSMEQFGHTASDTQGALSALVLATGDTSSALDAMQVVADLAAAKHESLTDAATQLGKVADGNTKLLKQYGITTAVAAGNTQEFDTAVGQLGDRLAGQASAQANTFSGHIAAIKAEVEDAGAKFAAFAGGPLTYVGTGISLLSGLMEIEAFRQETLTGKADAATEALLAEGVAAEAAGAKLTKAGEQSEATNGIGGFLSKLGPVGLGLGAVGLAAGVADVAMNLFGGDSKKAAQPIDDLTTALNDSAGAFNSSTRASIINQAQSQGLFTISDKINYSQAQLVDGLNGSSTAYNANVKSLQNLITAGTTFSGTRAGSYKVLDSNAQAAQNLLTQYEAFHDSVGASVQDAKDQASADAGAATEAKNLSDVLGTLTSTTDSYSNALKTLTGGSMSAATAQNSFLDSVDSVSSSVKDNGRSLDVSTAAGRKNNEAVLSAITAAQQHAAAVQQQTNSVDLANVALGTDEDAIRKAAAAAGLNTQQINQMIKTYGGLPSDVKLTLDTNFETQLSTLTQLSDKFSALNGAHAAGSISLTEYTIEDNYLHAQAKQSASGGVLSHAAGGTINTIDEAGGEILTLPNGTKVMPHGQSMQYLRDNSGPSGGGVTNHYNITVNVPSVVQPSPDTMRAIVSHLEGWARQGGQMKIARAIN